MKKLLCILLALLFVLPMTACGKNKAGSGKTLTVGVMNTGDEYTIAKALARGFESANEGVKVKVERIAGNYTQTVASKYLSNSLPDVMFTQDDTVAFLAEKGIFQPLDEYFTKDGVNVSDYYEKSIKITQCLDDGKMYFVPRDYNKVVVLLNLDFFNNYGVTLPNDDWTWADFLTICEEFRTKMDAAHHEEDQWPIFLNVGWKAVYWPIINGFGSDVFGDNNQVLLNKDTEGIKQIINVVEKRYEIDPNAATTTTNIFNAQQAAMGVSVRPNTMATTNYVSNVKAVPFPALPKAVVGMGCAGYGMSSTSKNKDLAWDFLKYVISKEGQNAFSTTGYCVPVLKELASDAEDHLWRNSIIDPVSRQPIELNDDAFIKYPERDLLTNFMNKIPAKFHQKLYDETNTLITSMFVKNYAGYDTLEGLIEHYKSNVAQIIK